MNGFTDSPFFRMFSTTNSLLLGVGALYLASYGREKCVETTENGDAKLAGRKRVWTDMKNKKYSASQDLEDFVEQLAEWNRSLTELERLLSNDMRFRSRNEGTVADKDEVDAMEVAGFHSSEMIYEKVDKTLNSLVNKVSLLRKMLKGKQNHNDFTLKELSLAKDDDSDADSFLSAASDVEEEVNDSSSDIDYVQKKALHASGIHRDKPFYLKALEHYFKHGIKCRRKRTKMVECSNDIEFLAKLHCIREASKVTFASEDVRLKFERNGTELLCFLIRTAGKDQHECEKRWTALLEFCKKPKNFNAIERELSKKGVPYINFYDVVLDFVVMDAFVDLENPPYSIQAAVQNSWLPTYIQQTGLETAVWGVLKAKMQMLEEPAGFLMHFYHLSEILTPVLAWGFLGSEKALKNACSVFKDELMGFIKDLFNFEMSDYSSLEGLSRDISKLAEQRYNNLKPLLTQSISNGNTIS